MPLGRIDRVVFGGEGSSWSCGRGRRAWVAAGRAFV